MDLLAGVEGRHPPGNWNDLAKVGQLADLAIIAEIPDRLSHFAGVCDLRPRCGNDDATRLPRRHLRIDVVGCNAVRLKLARAAERNAAVYVRNQRSSDVPQVSR